MKRVVSLLAGLCLSSGAAAQQGILEGTSGAISRIAEPEPASPPGNPNLSPQTVARITTLKFAQCMLRSNHAAIIKSLDRPIFDFADVESFASVTDENCLGSGELRMPANVLRGAFFTVLYRNAYSAGPPSLHPTALGFSDGASPPYTDKQQQWIALRQFADCVVRGDIGGAHAALLAQPGSKAEAGAFARLSPHLGACLPRGSTLKFSRSILSGLFAEVMNRQAEARR